MTVNENEKPSSPEQPVPTPDTPSPSTPQEVQVPVEPIVKPGVSFPEGGLRAWKTVAGCWAVMFITFGYVNAFGYDTSLSAESLIARVPAPLLICDNVQCLRGLLRRHHR
jgi:hypothetical protein